MRMHLTVLVFAALPLAGCEQDRSADYYAQHLDEARETLSRCQANGQAGGNCGNATTAIARAAREQFEQERQKTQKNIENGSIFPMWNGK